jgi:PAS domain S-box-containing protein
MRAMQSGGMEGIEDALGFFDPLVPFGMVLLRLARDSEHPLLDAEWVQANPVAQQAVPGSEHFQGLRVRDIIQVQGAAFVEELVRWEEQLARHSRLSVDVEYRVGEGRVVFHADMRQHAEHLMVWLRDITAERDEVAAMRRKLDLLQTVIHSTSDAIFAKDLEGRYTLVNPAAARALGSTPACILGQRDQDLFLPEDAEATQSNDRAVLAAGHPLTYEDKDLGGQRVWLSTKGVLRDETGSVTGLFGIARDITARKRMEQALRESEARYRMVARATRDVLWDWNLAQGEVRWSTSLGEVFGEVPERGQASVSWWKERIHPEDRERELHTLHQAMEGRDNSWANEYRFLRADGTYAFVLERGYIDRDVSGRPERLIGTMMDVSARRQREEEKVQEARLIERFMGIVGHDLGSPLAAIRISSQMLQHAGNLTLGQRNTLARIEDSTRRVSHLTRQLLDGVRARGGGIPVQPALTDLTQVCRRVIDELLAIYAHRAIELRVEGETRGWWDHERLAQVVSNLVGNALEHGEPRHPVCVRLWDEAGAQRLEVNNQGAPIPAELLPHLFEPFRRGATRERHASGGGLGLGLFIVQQIARAHGGDVEVHSTRAEGTTFRVLLPRESGAPPADT